MNKTYLEKVARLQTSSVSFVRIAIFIVMAWIGGLKFVPYEADSIVPFVANSPAMSFFYAHPAPEYRAHANKEGEYVESNFKWHTENNTYKFSYALGTVIVFIGLLMLFGVFNAKVGLIASALTIGMSFTTLSFLITTPEAWVSNLGAGISGFPYLAGPGRLVIKDLIMLAGAWVCLTSSAQSLLKE